MPTAQTFVKLNSVAESADTFYISIILKAVAVRHSILGWCPSFPAVNKTVMIPPWLSELVQAH
jgi:hypothetical protein